MTAGEGISPFDFWAASYKTNKRKKSKLQLSTNVFDGIQIRTTMDEDHLRCGGGDKRKMFELGFANLSVRDTLWSNSLIRKAC